MKPLFFSSIFFLAACSSAGSVSDQYKTAVDCQILTGVTGTVVPGIEEAERTKLRGANVEYSRRSIALGGKLNKSGSEMNDDVRNAGIAIQDSIKTGGHDVTLKYIERAKLCAQDVG